MLAKGLRFSARSDVMFATVLATTWETSITLPLSNVHLFRSKKEKCCGSYWLSMLLAKWQSVLGKMLIHPFESLFERGEQHHLLPACSSHTQSRWHPRPHSTPQAKLMSRSSTRHQTRFKHHYKHTRANRTHKTRLVFTAFPGNAGKVYIGETGRQHNKSRNTKHHGRLGHLEKSAIIKHSHEQDHRINWKETKLIAPVSSGTNAESGKS